MAKSSQYDLIHSAQKGVQRHSLVRQLLNALITLPIVLYALFLAVYHLTLHTPLAETWWLRFYNIFGYLLYLPLPFLLLLLLLPDQRRIRSLALLIPLLLFGIEYGPAFVPKLHLTRVAAAQSDLSVRVMTWNTYFRNAQVDNLVAAVQRENPDILAVEEFGAVYADKLASSLKANYPYQLLYPSYEPKGYAIFSRYPLKEELQPLAEHGACPCVQATVTIQGRDISLFAIHPTVPEFDIAIKHHVPVPTYFETYAQDFQHQSVLNHIAVTKTPLLVVGDFNASDRMAIIDKYRALLTDSYREAGWGFGFTFPYEATFRSVELPSLVRLDYIFHDNSWRALQAWVGAAHGADHRYVVADLVLKGQ